MPQALPIHLIDKEFIVEFRTTESPPPYGREHSRANLNLRVHRALSWLQRAEQAEDEDGRFIFLWIAFNAAYATEIDEDYRLSEQATFRAFLEKLCELDEHKQIDNLVWQEFSSSIRILLDTPFVLQSFWDFHSGKISEAQWKERLAQGKKMATLDLPAATPHSCWGGCLTVSIPCATS